MSILNDTLRELDQTQLRDAQRIIDELAKLPSLEYDLKRVDQAKALNIRPKTLDDEVKQRRPKDDDDKRQGRKTQLYEPQPWETPVDPGTLLDEIAETINRHMVIQPHNADVVALWTVHSHVFDLFSHTARLAITSPAEECGKTVLMAHLIGNMATRPMPAEDLTPAPFFRLAELSHPTYLIDEVDQFINEDSDLLTAINNGWEPHGGVTRCVGKDFMPRTFSTHTPVVLAGVSIEGKLKRTTLSRSIIISLDRATPEEEIGRDIFNKRRHTEALRILGRKIARVVIDYRDDIENANPTLPQGVRNRLEDKWLPLFCVASLGGERWLQRARTALLAHTTTEAPMTTALELLQDIRAVIGNENIWTTTLIERLCEIEGSRWDDYNFTTRDPDRRRISDRQIANLLKPYKIKPEGVRIGQTVLKGYKISKLRPVFIRYLDSTPDLTETPLQANNQADFSPELSVTSSESVTDENRRKRNNNEECNAVTARERGADEKDQNSEQDRIDVAI